MRMKIWREMKSKVGRSVDRSVQFYLWPECSDFLLVWRQGPFKLWKTTYMFDTTLTTNLRPDLSVFVAALHRGKEKHTDSQLVGCLKGNCLRGEHALGRACASFVSVCKKANMLSGGSTNGPRAAQRSLSLNDPPQLAVQSKSLAQQKLLNAQTIFDHNPSIHFVAQKCTLAVCSIHKYVVWLFPLSLV